jgi:hypothetical protein
MEKKISNFELRIEKAWNRGKRRGILLWERLSPT